MAQKKYTKKSDIMPKRKIVERFDSLAEREKLKGDVRQDMDTLHRMEVAWRNDEYVRQEGERCHRYVYGDQWGDMVYYDGKWMTERKYLQLRGKVPLTNNVTRRLITAVKGSYMRQKSEPRYIPFGEDGTEGAEMLSRALITNWRRTYNNMSTQLANAIENFLVRGVAVMGESYERVADGRFDARTKLYDHRKVAIESAMNDPLMDDISLIGIIHDVRPNDFLAKFGTRIKSATLEAVKNEYGRIKDSEQSYVELDNNERNSLDYLDFYNNNDPLRWRFYEIWTKEIKNMILCVDPARPVDPFKVVDVDKLGLEEYDGLTVLQENERRRKEAQEFGIPDDEVPYIDYGQYGEDGDFDGTGPFVDEYWYVRFITPRGTVIDEYVSPYECGCPITVVKFPYINGEVHSYISDVLPQQRYINRLVTLNDVSIRSAAKGALVVDTYGLSDDQDTEDVKEQWGDPDGVVFWDSRRGGQKPFQMSNTSTNVGIDTALSMQLGLMEDISGVHGAAQGKDALSGQSGSLYAQQAANSSTMLLPVLEAFRDFVKMVATKKMSIINQFWETGRPINTYGSDLKIQRFDRSLLEDLEGEITIINGDDMETAATVANQVAMQIFARGAMDAKALLSVGTWPQQFKDKALKVIAEQEAAMMQQNGITDPRQFAQLQQDLPQQQALQLGNELYNGNKAVA